MLRPLYDDQNDQKEAGDRKPITGQSIAADDGSGPVDGRSVDQSGWLSTRRIDHAVGVAVRGILIPDVTQQSGIEGA
jgi:hypothetical protein